MSVILLGFGVMSPSSTWAQAARAWAQAATAGSEPKEVFPVSGNASAGVSAGAGTFVMGESQRPNVNASLSLSAIYALGPGLGASLGFSVSKNLMTNVDSGAVREYDTTFGDIGIGVNFSPQISSDGGPPKPLSLGGGTVVSFGLGLSLPTSRRSQYIGRILAITPSVLVLRPNLFGQRITLFGQVAFVKEFNRYTTAVVDNDDGLLIAPRTGGAELLGDGLISTGLVNRSHAVRTRVTAAFQFGTRWSANITYLLLNSWSYAVTDEVDEFTSPYAKAGGGRTDFQQGSISVDYQLDSVGSYVVSASLDTVSAPFSLDNSTYRFPFFDFRSTADNYSTVGLSLTRWF